MSQDFLLGDETLWNPSNGAARLFCQQVELFEAELGLPSGIGPMHSDESQLDPSLFTPFVHALLTRHRHTSHAIILTLSEGFTATVLVLAERAGIALNWAELAARPQGARSDIQVGASTGMSLPPEPDAWAASLREKAAHLSRRMPR
ncbi:DUF6086 family protein [Streptomyces sp. LaPpAH-108]|uniref:DUF6086 family protein n=1 Tax=Streptomyces sp. LaPpAH-108 TaxID=1155714 RepID=UPI0003648EB4|nr:DUF6086 family protein [Streptomyces sp. LaPpAH-108]